MKINDIADIINVTEKDPATSGIDIFVGLEHYDIAEPVIKRFGSTKMLSTAAKKFETGDVLIARRNVYLQRASIARFAGLTSGDSIVLRVKKDLDVKGTDYDNMCALIPFILNSINFWDYANTNADGTMSKRLSPAMLLDYEFTLPSLAEQKVLAEKLWAAYEVKQSYLKMIAATEEMVKAQFVEMFGDPMVNDKHWPDYKNIGEVAQIVLGSTPNSRNPLYWDGDIRWITPAEMAETSYYIYDTERHITDEGRKSANLTLLPEGAVLFSTRAPIGKVAIVGKDMCCNQGFKNFICSDSLNNVFLYYTLKFKKDYLCSLGTGTTFKELSKRTVESLQIAVPPIKLQKKFASIYNQADKSISELRKSVDAIDKVIKSLIYENL